MGNFCDPPGSEGVEGAETGVEFGDDRRLSEEGELPVCPPGTPPQNRNQKLEIGT